jgi:hypothetical protein
MNLVKEYLVTIAGVHIYAIISMMIFLVAFSFILYQMYKMSKEEVKDYSRLPIDDDDCAQK